MWEWACSPSSVDTRPPEHEADGSIAVERAPGHVPARRERAHDLAVETLAPPGAIDHLVDPVGIGDRRQRSQLTPAALALSYASVQGSVTEVEPSNGEARAEGAGLVERW